MRTDSNRRSPDSVMTVDDNRSTGIFSCCFRCVDSEERPRIFQRLKQELPELKHRCRNLFNRRDRPLAGQFRYDPLSYALNFADDTADADDEIRLRDFSARYVVTPRAHSQSDGRSPAAGPMEITCN